MTQVTTVVNGQKIYREYWLPTYPNRGPLQNYEVKVKTRLSDEKTLSKLYKYMLYYYKGHLGLLYRVFFIAFTTYFLKYLPNRNSHVRQIYRA